MSDFRVSSNGHCFFCLSQFMEQGHNPATRNNSLQYFTRYLKMDLKKVFIDKGHVSPELMAKVEKAKLKVELCEECNCLSERFSEVYRQLEKLEMELGSTLELIHGKLLGADTASKLRCLTDGLNANSDGLLEVFDVLRTEATQKSTRKPAVSPRIKIQKVSKKVIKEKQSRHDDVFKSNQKILQFQTNTDFSSDLGLVETSGIKMESLNYQCLSANDKRNDFSDDFNSNLDTDYHYHHMETDAEQQQGEFKSEMNTDNILGTKTLGNDVMVGKNVGSRTARNMSKNWSINPETGKRKCNDCPMEFNSQPAFWYHYRTVHLKVRYKCLICNQLFAQKSSLMLHQRKSQSCSTTESVCSKA